MGFIDSVAVNLVAGLLVAVIVGGVAYWKATIPDISGMWLMTVEVRDSEYNPFIGMQLTYLVMLSQRSGDIRGAAEKVHEVSALNPTPGFSYQGRDRHHSEVYGGVKGNIFQRKELQLVFKENGARRSFLSVMDISRRNDNLIVGTYESTAANSSGVVTFTRKRRGRSRWPVNS